MQNKIVILEDNQERIYRMTQQLAGTEWDLSSVFFRDSSSCVAWLKMHLDEVRLVSLDHDLEPGSPEEPDPGNGREVADFLASLESTPPVIVHSANYHAAIGMEMELQEAGARVVRVTPWEGIKWIRREWIKTVKDLLGLL